jgi:hypothetical protein
MFTWMHVAITTLSAAQANNFGFLESSRRLPKQDAQHDADHGPRAGIRCTTLRIPPRKTQMARTGKARQCCRARFGFCSSDRVGVSAERGGGRRLVLRPEIPVAEAMISAILTTPRDYYQFSWKRGLTGLECLTSTGLSSPRASLRRDRWDLGRQSHSDRTVISHACAYYVRL